MTITQEPEFPELTKEMLATVYKVPNYDLEIYRAPDQFSVGGIDYEFNPENEYGQGFFTIKGDGESLLVPSPIAWTSKRRCKKDHDWRLDEQRWLNDGQIYCTCVNQFFHPMVQVPNT